MVQQAAEFISIELSPNPVTVGQSVIIKVELHDFSHSYWSKFTHTQLNSYIHKEMNGDE